MKHALSFLAGVALISLCVIATHSLPGYMFLLGYMVSIASIVILSRAISFARVARFFLYLDGIRLAPHWSSGANRLSKTGVPGSHGYTSSPVSRQVAAPDGHPVTTPWVGDPCETAASGITSDNPARQYERRTRELPARRYSRTARNAGHPRENSVQSSNGNNVLPTTQQEVLSALINLGVSFGKAEEAVHAAAKEHGGESFDEMFRTAISLLNAGKSRRAAA